MLAPNEPIKLNILQLPKNFREVFVSPFQITFFVSFRLRGCDAGGGCGACGFSHAGTRRRLDSDVRAFIVELRLDFKLRLRT